MKRLLIAGALAGAALAGTAPAQATIVTCDNMPVMVRCYSFREGKWCTVWVAALSYGCAEDVIGNGTVALDVRPV